MPLIPIYPTKDTIDRFHQYLIEIYREQKQPKYIEPGYNYEGLIELIIEQISTVERYGERVFSHFLEKAAYMFYHLNRGHPFNDGNKRTSILVTYFFLMWNGYYLYIPSDSHEIVIAIADSKRKDVTLRDAYKWIIQNTDVSIFTLLYHLMLVNLIYFCRLLKLPISTALTAMLERREFVEFFIDIFR